MQKTKVASAVESTLDNLAIVNAIGTNLGTIEKKQGEIDTLKEDTNQKIVVLFNRKVVVGRYSKDGATKGCAYACAFIDACVSAGIKKNTAQQVYLPTFKDAVKTGKPVVDWNKARANASNKKKNAKGKGKSTLSNLLVKAFNHDEGKSFEALCLRIMEQYEDAQFDTIYDGFIDYLASEGFEITA